ncbi:MAG: phage holin family protein [Rubrivivax sp.]|nr:phage holin family protein [Rubrivivax sp.]
MVDPHVRSGLFASSRRLLGTGVQWLLLRLELLAAELQLGAAQAFDAIVLVLLAGLGIGVGLVLACAWLVLMLQEPYRLTALGTLATVFLGVGAGLIWRARKHLDRAGRALDGSRGELARDLQALTPRD